MGVWEYGNVVYNFIRQPSTANRQPPTVIYIIGFPEPGGSLCEDRDKKDSISLIRRNWLSIFLCCSEASCISRFNSSMNNIFLW
jgi:hypothetical protein